MRHRVAGRKLNRTTSHRQALFSNMATSLVESERVETTLSKAKEMRWFADHLITVAKKNNLSARQRAFRLVRSKSLVNKLFADLAPRFKNRNGGYSRVLKLGFRLGDSAPMAIIEYLPGEKPVVKEEKKAKKKTPKKAKPQKKAQAPKKEGVKAKEVKKKPASAEAMAGKEEKKEKKGLFRRLFGRKT